MSTIERILATIDAALADVARPPIMSFVIGTTEDGCPILGPDAPDVCENVL